MSENLRYHTQARRKKSESEFSPLANISTYYMPRIKKPSRTTDGFLLSSRAEKKVSTAVRQLEHPLTTHNLIL